MSVRPKLRTSLVVLLAAGGAAPGGRVEAAFEDVSLSAGFLWPNSTWGASFVDFDLDGNLDLYLGRHGFEPKLYWNDGQWSFDPNRYPPPWTGTSDRHGTLVIPLGLDEYPDLLITHGAGEGNELYRNDGPGNYSMIPATGGIDDPLSRLRAVSAADYDGDFVPDLWIGKAPSEFTKNSLYRGLGSYSLVDVAPSVGLDESVGTVGGIWGDYDDDGDPDLLVGGEEFPRPTILYRNDGGSFTDVTSILTPAPPIVSGADWGDFDNDGDLALCDGQIGLFDTFAEGDTVKYFFHTSFGEDGVDGLTVPSTADTLGVWLRIRGTFEFSLIFLGPSEVVPSAAFPLKLTDEYVGAPVFDPGVDQGIWVWRQSPGGPWEVRCSTPFVSFDNFDGTLIDHSTITGVTPHGFEDAGFVSGGPKVWRNDGGSFTEITGALGLPAEMVNPREVSWVDWDNDGDLDLHVVDKGTSALPGPDALFRNDGATFVDVTLMQGLTGASRGMGDGATWGDVDGDGDLDMFLAAGGGPKAFGGSINMYRNDGPIGPSILIDLVGIESGVAALGTKVVAHVGGKTITRWRTANSWRGFADAPAIHIGLGEASQVDSLVIEWPFGTVDVYPSWLPGHYRLNEGQLATGVTLGAPAATGSWRLAAPHPQPARGVQSFLFDAPRVVTLEIAIFDAAGRRIRRLHDGPVPSGPTAFRWDGRDDAGQSVASGVYFLRASDGRSVVSTKSVRVR